MGIKKLAQLVFALGLIAMTGPVFAGGGPERDVDAETLLWMNLALNRDLHAADLKVDVAGGIARIDGVVDEAGKKRLAGQIAADIIGVNRVENRILVSRNSACPVCNNGHGGRELIAFDW